MKDFFDQLETELIKMWNYLYRFLCQMTGTPVNEDWLVDTLA